MTVHDTTPPTITAPASVTLTSATPVPAGHPSIAGFLAGATAHDTVDAHPSVSAVSPPSSFPVGTTPVTFRAVDASGNAATATASVVVVPPQQGGGGGAGGGGAVNTPPSVASAPHSAGIPPDVTGLRVSPGDHEVFVSWQNPTAASFDHVVVLRSRTDKPGAAPTAVYSGSGTSFRNTHLVNGVTFRYTVVSYNDAGEHSKGVSGTARPMAHLLVQPANGAHVRQTPSFVWAPTPRATYYNLQLFHKGKKVLTVWPKTAHFTLPRSWAYGKTTETLTPGTYTWYVWAGFGTHRDRHYGPLLGSSTFVVPAAT